MVQNRTIMRPFPPVSSLGQRSDACETNVVVVVCGSGPGGSRPHNRRCVRHRGTEQPWLSRTAAVE